VLKSVDPLPLVDLSVLPLVAPKALGFAPHILALVDRPVAEALEPFALFEVVGPLSLVYAAVCVEHDA
jgi:hypothetical protein